MTIYDRYPAREYIMNIQSSKKIAQSALAITMSFIDQEVYRLAVIQQYPNDYSRIQNLYDSVRMKLECVEGNVFHSSALEEILETIINCIVLGVSEDTFNHELGKIIERYESILIDVDLSSGMMNENDQKAIGNSNINNDEELFEGFKDIVRGIFLQHYKFPCSIPHRYPPIILALMPDYDRAWWYFYEKEYAIHIENDDTSTLKKYLSPYAYSSPLAVRSFYRASEHTQDIDVPDNAVSKVSNDGRSGREVSLDNIDYFDGMAHLLETLCLGMEISTVTLTKELHFTLDMSEPLSSRDVDKFISDIKMKIAHANNKNRDARMILAQSQSEVSSIYKEPRINTTSYEDLMILQKPELPKISTRKDALKCILGLKLRYKHWVNIKEIDGFRITSWGKKRDKKTLEYRADSILDEQEMRGATEKMVKEGGAFVSQMQRVYLNAFQKGRVQFDIKLSVQQREKSRCLRDVALNEIHPDDIERVNNEIAFHKGKNIIAVVKERDNGSYIITW